MALVTLVYNLNADVQILSNKLLVRAADINFDQGVLTILGMKVVQDDTVLENGAIKKTIVLETLPAGDSTYKTPEQLKDATRNIFRDVFALRMPALVTAEEPVVS